MTKVVRTFGRKSNSPQRSRSPRRTKRGHVDHPKPNREEKDNTKNPLDFPDLKPEDYAAWARQVARILEMSSLTDYIRGKTVALPLPVVVLPVGATDLLPIRGT